MLACQALRPPVSLSTHLLRLPRGTAPWTKFLLVPATPGSALNAPRDSSLFFKHSRRFAASHGKSGSISKENQPVGRLLSRSPTQQRPGTASSRALLISQKGDSHSTPIHQSQPWHCGSITTFAEPYSAYASRPIAHARTRIIPSPIRPSQRRLFTSAKEKSNTPPAPPAATGPLDRVGWAKLLTAAPNFVARLKLRLKQLLMRQNRPWRMDDFIALFSWAFVANVAFVLLGTTTFFSVVLATANSLQFQEYVAKKISDYLSRSTGVNIKFEAAIAPNWKDGRITLRNVVLSKRAKESSLNAGQRPISGQPKGEDHSGHDHEHDLEHHHSQGDLAHATAEDIDTNFTMFDLTIDQVDITLSARRWLDGKGPVQDASVKGIRGVIDRTNVWTNPEEEYIPELARRKHVSGDFELQSLELDDMLVTILQPKDFRPYTVSIFSAQLPCFRKQWICYDLLCAESMTGMFDGCLFSCYTAQRANTEYQNRGSPNSEWKRTTRFKMDDVKIDHLNRGVEGPVGWITSGTVDITCVVRIPREPREDVLRRLVNDFVEKVDEVVDYATPLPPGAISGGGGRKDLLENPNRAAAALQRRMIEEEEELERTLKGEGQHHQHHQHQHHRHHHPHHRHETPEEHLQEQQQLHQQHMQALHQQEQQQPSAVQRPAQPWAQRIKYKRPALVLDLEFKFNDIKATIPRKTTGMTYLNQAMIRPLVAFMNSHRTVTPIRCRVEMDVSEFDGAWNIHDSNLIHHVSTEVGKEWARLVADERERNRKLKRVGLWGLQSVSRNIVSVFDYARGSRGFWDFIGVRSASSASVSHH